MLSTGKSHQDFPEPPTDLGEQANRSRWLELDAVIHKACHANVRERFQSAEAMHAELKLLDDGHSVRHKRTVQRRWVAARRLALGALATALLCLVLPFFKPTRYAHTPNPEAVRLYRLGQWYYNQLTPEDHVNAVSNLTLAAQIDPKFPQPYGELIALYGWSMLPGLNSDQERLQRAREIVKKLTAIDPNLPQTHTALSFFHFLERDWQATEQEIRRAIQVSPDFAIGHFLYCYYLGLEGRTAEAEREGQQAQLLEPPEAARVAAIAASWPFMAERRFDLAIAQLKQVLKLDRNFAAGHDFLAYCYEAQSNYLSAIEESRTSALLSAEDPVRIAEIFDGLREAYKTGGEQGYLRKWVELIHANAALPKDQQSEALGNEGDLAGYYAKLGEKKQALDELERHFDEPNVWSQIKFAYMYDNLHAEPRYKALVRRAGLDN